MAGSGQASSSRPSCKQAASSPSAVPQAVPHPLARTALLRRNRARANSARVFVIWAGIRQAPENPGGTSVTMSHARSIAPLIRLDGIMRVRDLSCTDLPALVLAHPRHSRGSGSKGGCASGVSAHRVSGFKVLPVGGEGEGSIESLPMHC